jgi:hypothetical protein
MLKVCIQKNRMNIFHEAKRKSGMRRGDKTVYLYI